MPLPQQSSPAGPSPASSAAGGWYYKAGRRIEGPIDFRELRELAQDKLILKETEVWQEGDEERRLAASVMGLLPNRKSSKPKDFRPTGKISLKAHDNPYAPPKVATIQDGPPGGLYLPYLRQSSFWPLPLMMILGLSLGYLAVKFSTTEEAKLTLVVLGAMAVAASIALSLIYLHRAWEMLRVVGASLAGHKAVTFMAIPFFNAVWSFFALLGWSRSWNYQVRRHPGLSEASASWTPLFLLFCIGFLASQGLLIAHLVSKDWPVNYLDQRHQISLATFAATVALGLGVWAQLCQSINFLARKKS